MIRRTLHTGIGLLCLPLVLCACSRPDAPPAGTSVAVATVMPVRRVFHDHVDAWGTLTADPHATRSMTLPYGIKVVTVDVIQGQAVGRGDPLLVVAPDPAAQRAYTQAVDAVTLARKKLDQTRQLLAQHLATRARRDAAQKALDDARATLQSVQVQGGGQTEVTLKAPADGVVGSLKVQAGQQAAAGTPLLVFLPDHAMVASLQVLPEDTARLHAGQHVHLHGIYDSHASWEGTLTTLGHAVSPQTHMVDAVVMLDGHPRLASGSTLSATIDTSRFKAWAVPRAALQSDAQGSYLLQIEHGKARRVNVEVLASGGTPNAVSGNIDPHAPIITLDSHEIVAGDMVHAAKPGLSSRAHGSAEP